MDEKFDVINRNIHSLRYGSIEREDYYSNSHDYIIIDDNHYLLATITCSKVNNIPGENGKERYVRNVIIQEQKDGQVIMQWESVDHPELYELSIFNKEYSKTSKNYYVDYVHWNSLAIDPGTGDLLISCKYIGLIKINRTTGAIIWVMGRKRNDTGEMSERQIGFKQHDARYLKDGSITVFDNAGGIGETARVCQGFIAELRDFAFFT